MTPVVSAYMPVYDGDMATLEELQERIFDELDIALLDGRAVTITPSEPLRFYWEEQHAVGVGGLGFRYWPDDRAAEQLAVWRAQLDGVA
jgi:hypothetical protein